MRKRCHTDVGGTPVAYIDEGTGPATLFIHGVFLSADLWAPTIDLITQPRRAIAVDLPAHGLTPATSDMSLPALADLLAGLCDRLADGPLDIVANDTGGALAQVFAVRHRSLVRTLTLTDCDTAGNFPPALFAPVVELARQGELAPVAAGMINDLDFARSEAALGMGFETPPSDELILDFLTPCAGTLEAARDLERFVASLDDADLVAVDAGLRQLDAPTLLVWGTDDAFFELTWAHRLADTIPGATLIELDGARLFFPLERPGQLVAALERHWAVAHAS